jgi:ribosomal protein S11
MAYDNGVLRVTDRTPFPLSGCTHKRGLRY